MSNSIQRLIEAQVKAQQVEKIFVAPLLPKSKVAIIVNKLKQVFTLDNDFEGWGKLRYQDGKLDIFGQADEFEIADYVSVAPKYKLILIRQLRGQTWLAYPANAESFKRKFEIKPLAVHLVRDGAMFKVCDAMFEGNNFFYADETVILDSDLVTSLKTALEKYTKVSDLVVKYLTPEMKVVYQIAYNALEEADPVKKQEKRVKELLVRNGGKLNSITQRSNDQWMINWVSPGGDNFNTIVYSNLNLHTAGLCLARQDAQQDFHSLIHIVDKRHDNDYDD